ncbi:hypothetical protein [Ancylobacter mangrovi]|uniref:Uncharacterized protein n=1 Tax=Ancylobacter mangrovi TaxID=2972472 RepID=A0A9X2T2Z5_9HYPH|nr:hypothetical protein [Ancylobacter mangrovi]MCS0496745.1 hypothetical protein [Ancylobacter mangrovi]MCS0504931.1 hypothetical protein [Ancylobacter mangrovi]
MKRIATVFCALALTVAATGAAFADCSPGHTASAPPVQTDTKGS